MIDSITGINVVLDIDGVLAFCDAEEESVRYFLRKDLILTAIEIHYLVPGVFAFIRFIFSMEEVTVSFFSAGIEERNKIFVEKLLLKALGSDWYHEVKNRVKILSRQHLSSPPDEEERKQRIKYRGTFGTGEIMKSLKLIVEEGESTNNCILVDDMMSNTAPGEEESLLYVPATVQHSFLMNHDDEELELNQGLNRIFYAAGMIFQAINTARAEGTPVSRVLSRMQFKQKSANPPEYKSRHHKSSLKDSIYHVGLKELQKFDPLLSFTSTHTIRQILKNPMTQKERELLRQYQDARKECSII